MKNVSNLEFYREKIKLSYFCLISNSAKYLRKRTIEIIITVMKFTLKSFTIHLNVVIGTNSFLLLIIFQYSL